MGGHIHIRRLLRFGFDNWESRKFTLVRQRQSNETHPRGASVVARFDEQGNARASGCGTSDRTWLHVFYACISVINNNC